MAENVLMPKLGLTMSRGTVTKWDKKENDEIKKGDIICQVETDKITSDVESPSDGVLLKILVNEGDEEQVLAPICVIGAKGEIYTESNSTEPEKTSRNAADSSTAGKSSSGRPHIKISPLAEKMAEENNIDITLIKGSGPNGRILKEDIIARLNKKPPEEVETQEAQTGGAPERREYLSGIRMVTAERLSESKKNIPHAYYKVVVDAGAIIRLRKDIAAKSAPEIKPTINDIILLCVGRALDKFRQFNVSVKDGQIIYHDDINVGMAVDTPKGLFVPVIKKANCLGLSAITEKSRELSEKAKAGKLRYDDMSGGTFTVTNLGAYHIDEFFAIINPPESAILAVGRAEEKPFAENGAVTVKSLMNLCLSADHRVIDGALAAQFLKYVKGLLETPYLLIA